MNVDEFRCLYFDLSGDGNVSSIRQDAAYVSYHRCCGGKASSIRRSFLDFDFDGFVAIGFHSSTMRAPPAEKQMIVTNAVLSISYVSKLEPFVALRRTWGIG